jgi:hypothetical protein
MNQKNSTTYIQWNIVYRTCTNGFFVASKDEFIFYPYPTMQQLRKKTTISGGRFEGVELPLHG